MSPSASAAVFLPALSPSRGASGQRQLCGLCPHGRLRWLAFLWQLGSAKPSHSVWLWVPWSRGRSLGLPAASSGVLARPQGSHTPPWRGVDSPAAPTSCRLNSTEYGELCEKLRAPIRSAANVVIRQSLGDLFLETFASLVEANPAYSVPSSQVWGRLGPQGHVS